MRAPILLLAGAVSAALDCGSIESQPYFVVRAQSDGCLVECDDSFPNGTASFACYTFTDGVQHGFATAGLAPGSTCMNVTFESPDEAPGTEDPEMLITVCPQWATWAGWDRGADRTLGNLRQELMLKTAAAVQAFNQMW